MNNLYKSTPNLSNYLSSNIQESVLLSLALLSVCLKPLLDSEFGKNVSGGIGSLFGGIGEYFGKRAEVRQKRLEDKLERAKEKREREEIENELSDSKEVSQIDQIFGVARGQLDKEEQTILDQVSGSLRDPEGNLDPEGFAGRLEGLTGKTPEELAEETGINDVSKEDIDRAVEKFADEANKLTDKELDEVSKESQERAQKIAQDIDPVEPSEKEDEEEKESKKDQEDDHKADTSSKEDKDEAKKEEKETVQDEEITDPETGKKIKVKMHRGPQGGKYYWPEGSPHDPQHKVYVEGYMGLSEWLRR